MVLTDKQKQCLVNVSAVLAMYDLPALQLERVDEDACYYRFETEFWLELLRLAFDGKWCKGAEGEYREARAMYAMEISKQPGNLLRADFDYFNPTHGAGPALLHLVGEVMVHSVRRLWNRLFKTQYGTKTDPFNIRAGLVEKRQIWVPDIRTIVSPEHLGTKEA